ncbi:MAG: hypothetical protein QNJ02_01615 [Desulfobacterales bacterium]|nr:hypothetical protein [Desulfobacterales bacterium]
MLTTTDNLLLNPEVDAPRQTNAPAPIIRERIFGIPIDPEVLFADARNIYRERIEKRQRQLIVKLSFLRSFLHPGEKVILVTTAFSPLGLTEQLLTVGLFLDLERAIIVFTNYRILHVPVGRYERYRQSIAQIRYRDIRSIKLQRGALEIVYKKGLIEKFKAVAYAERRKIDQLLPALPLTKKVLSPSTRTHLCPRCARPLIKPTAPCARCGMAFKKKALLLLATLFTPGGGYLYMGHRRPFVYFSIAESAFAFVVLSILWPQGPAIFGNGLLGIALTAMMLLRGLAWFHAAHLLGEFIPRRACGKPLRLLQSLRPWRRAVRQPA